MEPIKRRGFLTGLAGFFGVAPLAAATSESGDVGDPELDGLPKPKAEGPRVVSCQIGDVIELECNGLRCRAVVTGYEARMVQDNLDLTGLSHRYDRVYHMAGVQYLEIDLQLRSTGDVTMAP